MRKRTRLAIFAAVLLPVLAFIVLARVAESKRTRLRIRNAGRYPAQDLVVCFPGSRVAFGTVPPGTTTDYEYVPKGVYGYAAFEYKVRGKVRHQPVIDWMGEKPMPGLAFTYTIAVHPGATQGDVIETKKVTKVE